VKILSPSVAWKVGISLIPRSSRAVARRADGVMLGVRSGGTNNEKKNFESYEPEPEITNSSNFFERRSTVFSNRTRRSVERITRERESEKSPD
jgi:hypothetical protein